MQLNSATLDQYRFEGLNTQAVQRWCAVQQYGMVFNNFFQYVPHFRLDTLHKAFRALDIVSKVLLYQFAHHEWFEQLQSHTFWQAALVQFQIGSYYDYRTARVVNTLTEQVLTEAPLLTFQHVGQALEFVVT